MSRKGEVRSPLSKDFVLQQQTGLRALISAESVCSDGDGCVGTGGAGRGGWVGGLWWPIRFYIGLYTSRIIHAPLYPIRLGDMGKPRGYPSRDFGVLLKLLYARSKAPDLPLDSRLVENRRPHRQ